MRSVLRALLRGSANPGEGLVFAGQDLLATSGDSTPEFEVWTADGMCCLLGAVRPIYTSLVVLVANFAEPCRRLKVALGLYVAVTTGLVSHVESTHYPAARFGGTRLQRLASFAAKAPVFTIGIRNLNWKVAPLPGWFTTFNVPPSSSHA